MRRTLRHTLLSLFCVATVLVVGCVSSKYTLVPPDQAKVDKAFLGDFETIDSSGKHSTILIRNIDDKSYYIELEPADGDKPTRMVGFTVPVKDAVFAEVREIRDDGGVPAEWSLMRLDLAGDKLTFRQLSEAYFKKANIDSAEALRKWVEANLDNREMYDHEASLIATRMK